MKKTRNAIVTGATAGIGLAVAREFLERGHNVYICGRQAERLTTALASLVADFGSERIAGSTCDVRSLASTEAMVAMAGTRFGGIDTLINNAGIGFVAAFEDVTPDQWQGIIDTNLTGVFNCCRAALPWLKKSDLSDIVNLGSRAGRYSFRGGTGYNTTKFGLQGFTEALFLDLHQYGSGLASLHLVPWRLIWLAQHQKIGTSHLRMSRTWLATSLRPTRERLSIGLKFARLVLDNSWQE